ncbi:hypothetical protein [Luteimonas sp. A649]
MHLSVFQDCERSFLPELASAGVEYRTEPGMPEYPKAKGLTLRPVEGTDAEWSRVIGAISIWVHGGENRYVHAALRDRQMTDLSHLPAATIQDMSDQIVYAALLDMTKFK